MSCCEKSSPVNIGLIREKWVCKECDADLEPTDTPGVFNKVLKYVPQSFTPSYQMAQEGDVDDKYYYDEAQYWW